MYGVRRGESSHRWQALGLAAQAAFPHLGAGDTAGSLWETPRSVRLKRTCTSGKYVLT